MDQPTSSTSHLVRNVSIAAASILAVVGILLWFVVLPNTVQSQGNPKEQAVATAYMNGANVLSSCLNQTDGAAQTVLADTAAFQKIVAEAVSGTGAAQSYQLSNPDGSTNKTAQTGLYALFVKAYPDQNGLTALYRQVITIITSCQSKFEHTQTHVLDLVRDFKSWRAGSWMTRTFGGASFPNSQMVIIIPGTHQLYTGVAALNLASVPIVNSTAANAYRSGTYNPTNPFGTSSPSANPSPSASS